MLGALEVVDAQARDARVGVEARAEVARRLVRRVVRVLVADAGGADADGCTRRRGGSSVAGSSVKTVPSPATLNGTAVPLHASPKASVAVTGSEKVPRMLAPSSTSRAPAVGSVAVIDGGWSPGGGSSSHPVSGSAGVRREKSAALSPVSPVFAVALVGPVAVRRRGRERRALLVGRAGRLPDLVDDRERRGEHRDAPVVGDPGSVGLVARGAAGAVGQQVGAARAAASRRPRPSRAWRPSRSRSSR